MPCFKTIGHFQKSQVRYGKRAGFIFSTLLPIDFCVEQLVFKQKAFKFLREQNPFFVA